MRLLLIAPGCCSQNLIELYAKTFDKVIILGQKKYKQRFNYFLNNLDKEIKNVDVRLTSAPAYTFRAIHTIRRERIDLVIAHDPKSGCIAYVAGKLTEIPVIFQMCQDFLEYLDVGLQRGIRKSLIMVSNKWMLKLCCRNFILIALSNHILQRARAYGGKHVSIIPIYGIDTSLFQKRKSSLKEEKKIEGPLILTVGRLTPEKGTIYLLRAMPFIREQFPDAKLYIVGDGDSNVKRHLQQTARDLKINEHITFVGLISQKDLPQYYNAADVFVCPSIKEGLGFVSGEAMACETPVVASNTGGIPDLVLNEKTGILVPPGDVIALRDAILKLLNNPAAARALVTRGKNHVHEKFSKEVVTKQFQALVRQSVKRRICDYR